MGPTRGDSIRITGTEYIGALTSSTTVGTILKTIIMNPRLLGSSRVSKMATFYERFKFHRFAVEYNQATTTSEKGSMVGYYELDPADILPDGGQGRVAAAKGHKGNSTTSLWTNRVWPCPAKYDAPMYYIDPGMDQRLSTQAVFYLLQEVSAASAITEGSISISYDVTLSNSKFDAQTDASGAWNVNVTNGTQSAASPFGTAALVPDPQSLLDVPYDLVSKFTLPSGFRAFKVDITLTGSGLASANRVLVNLQAGPFTNAINTDVINAGFTTFLSSRTYQVIDPTQPVSLTFTLASATSVTSAWCTIIPFDYPLTLAPRVVLQAERLIRDLNSALTKMRAISTHEHKDEAKYSQLALESKPDAFVHASDPDYVEIYHRTPTQVSRAQTSSLKGARG